MTNSLRILLDFLERRASRLSLQELERRLESLPVHPDDVRPYVMFSDDRYQRNAVRCESGYEVLVLCWKEGQRSPVHDHKGSICGVRVLQGTLTEVVYELDRDGCPEERTRSEYGPGSVCCSEDLDIHEACNITVGGGDLVTLHVYAPPLTTMGLFTVGEPGRREVAV